MYKINFLKVGNNEYNGIRVSVCIHFNFNSSYWNEGRECKMLAVTYEEPNLISLSVTDEKCALETIAMK